MASPIVIASLAGAALWFLLAPKKKKEEQTVTIPGGVQVTLPAGTLPVDDDLEKSPEVKVTVPAGATTAEQVATAVLPQLVQQATQQATAATGAIPTGVARFPDLPTDATPQQVATAVIPVVTAMAQDAIDKATPLQVEELKKDQDPNGTVLLARALIAAESEKGWKGALQSEIKNWQQKSGLVVDGKFGPKSAAKMADEVGLLPLIRYFPAASASKSAAVKAYRDSIYTKAANIEQKNPAHAAALRSSAAYEQGQGWAQSPAAIPVAARAAQAAALAAELKVA
jgi:hypothetical protein